MSEAHRTQAWRNLAKARVKLGQDQGEPCSRCGQPIDYTLSGRHAMGPSADHPAQLQLGGELLPPIGELRVMHLRCNTRSGAAVRAAKNRNRKISGGGPTLQANAPTFPPEVGDIRPKTAQDGKTSFRKAPGPLEDPFPPPRFASGPHPRRVGTYGPQAIEWIRARRLADDLIPDDEKEPLPAWSFILDRALEHDEDGRLCWPIVVLTVPRQSTKSSLMAELMAWRISHAELLGERQIAVHTANKLQAAIRIQEDLHPWAEEIGMKVNRRTGQERITHPDHSRWEITSLTAAFGARPSFAFIDEGFDVQRELVEKAILPAQARRKSPQLWLVSTANGLCTPLMPHYMKLAKDGSDRVCLLDWGLPADADPADRAWWPYTNPHPTEAYLAQVEANITSKDWLAQWLNVWPATGGTKAADELAMPGWAGLRHAPAVQPVRGGIYALDEARDGSHIGMVRLIGDFVYYAEYPTLRDAVAVANLGDHVIVGLSLVEAAVKEGLAHSPIKYGLRHTSSHTPLLSQVVKSGRLWHDHHPAMLSQAAGAVIVETESGKVLSAKKSSDAGILGPKLLAWALGYERSVSTQRAAIY
jgi:hypothetical protein